MKTDTTICNLPLRAPELLYDKRLPWTTERPTKPGHYWAYENLDECDADVLMLYIPERLLKEKRCYALDVYFNFNEFSHFMGPLNKPETPMTEIEKLMRYSNRNILLNACVGLERYKKAFGCIPNTILDMGAHIGGLTLQAMEQGVPCILAVEADGQNYKHLVENVKRQAKLIGYDGHVECLHRAFCCTNDDIVEIVGVGNEMSNTGQRSMFYSKSAKNVKKGYTVRHTKTINIDGIVEKLESLGAYTIDLFKCDIEGAEFTAMPMNNRTREFLSHIKYVDIELHPWTNGDYYDTSSFFQKHKEFDSTKRIVFQYFEFLRDCGLCVPDDILNTEHEYLKLTTYNKALCGEATGGVML